MITSSKSLLISQQLTLAHIENARISRENTSTNLDAITKQSQHKPASEANITRQNANGIRHSHPKKN
jgi:hypothetical protein